MYKQTEDTYTLDAKDKLVITYEGGKLRVLINNDILLHPTKLNLNTGLTEFTTPCNNKKTFIVNTIDVVCSSEG
ncbi:MAG: hypothetical protein RR585_09330 [Coprobacillus sp.]